MGKEVTDFESSSSSFGVLFTVNAAANCSLWRESARSVCCSSEDVDGRLVGGNTGTMPWSNAILGEGVGFANI